jgi:DNA replication protein DnaC
MEPIGFEVSAMAAIAHVAEPIQKPLRQTKTCTQHGNFISDCTFIAGIELWTLCPDCVEEDEQRSREYDQQCRKQEQQRLHSARLKRMHIPPRFHAAEIGTFEACTDEQKQVLSVVQYYVNEFDDNLRRGRNLIFMGKPGCGKTHLACSIANALGRRRRMVRYVTAAALVREIRDTWRKDSSRTESEVLDEIRRLDLLILDDIGVQFGSPAELIQLTEVVDFRYQDMKPTIVISNGNINDLVAFLGERAIDRLRDGGRVITFNWESWRTRHR